MTDAPDPARHQQQIEWVTLDRLKVWPANPRVGVEEAAEKLAKLIAGHGFVNPIIATPDGTIRAGHTRLAAAKKLGMEKVPVVFVDLEEPELFAVSDNQASTYTTFDLPKLKDILVDLDVGDLDMTFSGFDLGEIERLVPSVPNPDADEVPEVQEKAISKTGDLWILGEHRLLCGDSTKPEDVARLMGGEKATLVHADPPYGMGKEGDGIANDNLYREKLDAFQMAWWRTFRPYLADNGSAYIWGNSEDLWRLWFGGGLNESERLTFRNEIVWSKGAAGAGGISHMGAEGLRQYPGSTERCLFFMLGEQGFNNNADNYWEGWEPVRSALAEDCEKMGWGPEDIKRICGVGMHSHWFTRSQWCFIPEEHYRKLQKAARDHDAFKRDHDELKRDHDELKRDHDELKRDFYATRAHFDNTHDNMTDVWSFPRVTGEERHGHATPKPVAMIERAIKSSSLEGDCVIEPFIGSGSTLIACENLGRRCAGLDVAPQFCDVTIRRWEKLTEGHATLDGDGRTFAEVERERVNGSRQPSCNRI